MKDRIVIEGKLDIKHLKELEKEHDEKFMSFPEYRTEQVPETWEELKELCKDIKGDLKLTSDGKIYCYEYLIAENRTPAQMWQIIKSLIGEE